MSKKKQVKKVAKETGVEEKQLDRLPQEALQKLDDLVPDEDLIGSDEDPAVEVTEVDVDELNAQAAELEAKETEEEETPAAKVEESVKEDTEETAGAKDKVCVGWNPITKEKVYK